MNYNAYAPVTDDPIVLDLTGCTDLEEVHLRIQKTFGFPDYYGKNWDAMWDCLSDIIPEDSAHYEICIKGYSEMNQEMQNSCQTMQKIFSRLQQEYPHTEITYLTEKILLHDGVYRAEILPYGATLHALYVPDRDGAIRDVVLGYATLADYQRHDGYLGATVGRNANRIAGAQFVLDGEVWQLSANEGANQLHGGFSALHQKVWAWEQPAENTVTLRTVSPHGEDGYPGTVQVAVTYTLSGGALHIDYEAVSDRNTVVNLTNHAYFNLAGHDGGAVSDHVLTVYADSYTPCGAGTIPTGDVRAVDGTALDLRGDTALGTRLEAAELAEYHGYDHNFVLRGDCAAQLYCPRSGIAMEVETTLPGLQVYTAGFLTARQGKGGVMYGQHHGVCLETQYWPDAVHHPHFPSSILAAGDVYRQKTTYRFIVK